MTTTDGATFCATLVDEWVRAGVTDGFVAPGSRSTPLTLALAADDRLRLHLFHDERAAAFAALGHGLATRRPGVVLCTSGTAATHFHGAVVEADLSSVPLVVCTADRPPELWDVGAPQTMDQSGLYGSTVRFFTEPGVPDGAMAATWRSLASRLVAEAMGWSRRPGPVHANLSFRDPLVGEPGPLPPARPDGRPWHEIMPARAAGRPATERLTVEGLVADGRARPGAIVAGRGVSNPDALLRLAARLGWPVLADHRSGCRVPGTGDTAGGGAGEVNGGGQSHSHNHSAIRHFDSLLRSEQFTSRIAPEVILRVGEPLASKVTGQWLQRSGAEIIAVVDDSRWIDPERVASTVIAAPGALASLVEALPTELVAAPSAQLWAEADRVAAEAIDGVVAGHDGPSEIDLARQVITSVPSGGALVVSSSMPIRDVEWFGPNRSDITVHANRGANGIDGVIATAIGVATTGTPTTVLLGDVAFLHDSTALIGLADRPIDLQVAVIDNDGGGIFSFLPQAELLRPERFEQLFGTPHNTDLLALATAHRLPVVPWPTAPPTGSAPGPAGPRLAMVRTNRQANVALHDEVNRAVSSAVADVFVR